MWKNEFEAELKPQPGMDRYRAYYKREYGGFSIIDWWRAYGINPNLEPGIIPPDDAVLYLPPEVITVLLDAVAETKLIDRVLAGKVYTKDMADRHLDIIEKLIAKLAPGTEKIDALIEDLER